MENPSFFKIVLGEFDQLKIPQRFVQQFNNKLHRKEVLLMTSCGRYWAVNSKKIRHTIYLQGKGLKAFLEENSIELGDLLVFSLRVDSNFYVKMYGKDCCEKETPFCNRHVDRSILHKRKRKLEAIRPKCHTAKSGKARVLAVPDELNLYKVNIVKTEATEVHLHSAEKAPIAIAGTSSYQQVTERAGEGRPSIDSIAFHSEYPFFKLRLFRSYVSNYLQLPIKFVERYISKKIKTEASIVGTNGKTWPVRFAFTTSRAYLCGGWNSVISANNLREGSFCAFELTDADDIKFRMTVLN